MDYTYDDFTIRIEWDQNGYIATIIGLAAPGIDPAGTLLAYRHQTEAAARVNAEMMIKEKLAQIQRSKLSEYDDKQGEID